MGDWKGKSRMRKEAGVSGELGVIASPLTYLLPHLGRRFHQRSVLFDPGNSCLNIQVIQTIANVFHQLKLW